MRDERSVGLEHSNVSLYLTSPPSRRSYIYTFSQRTYRPAPASPPRSEKYTHTDRVNTERSQRRGAFRAQRTRSSLPSTAIFAYEFSAIFFRLSPRAQRYLCHRSTCPRRTLATREFVPFAFGFIINFISVHLARYRTPLPRAAPVSLLIKPKDERAPAFEAEQAAESTGHDEHCTPPATGEGAI